MQVMIDHYPDRSGKVQAANSTPDGNFIAGVSIPNIRGKTTGLLPEKQVIPIVHSHLRIGLGGMLAKSDQFSLSVPFPAVQKSFKAFMVPDIHFIPVVQPFSDVCHPLENREGESGVILSP